MQDFVHQQYVIYNLRTLLGHGMYDLIDPAMHVLCVRLIIERCMGLLGGLSPQGEALLGEITLSRDARGCSIEAHAWSMACMHA